MIFKKLIQLSLPLILAGLIQASVGFLATLFLAHYGTNELAAGAVVSWIFTTLMVIIWGTLSSISVLTAINHGEKNERNISYILRDGFILALLFSIFSVVLFWKTPFILNWLEQQNIIITLAKQYIEGLIWGIPPDFISLVLLQWLIGMSRVKVNLVYALILVPMNIFLNYALLFGKFGFPHWGIAGMGWGTSITFWITTVGLFVYLLSQREYRTYFINALSLQPPYFLVSLCEIGIPTGIMFSLQVAFFLVITLMMGHFGISFLAANQINLQYGWLSFVILYAIGQAVTVQVGHEFGKQNIVELRGISYHATLFVTLVIGCISLCFWIFPNKLISLDLDLNDPHNTEIIYYATQFLALAGIFQLFEALRIVFFSALRGIKDTHFSLWSSLISYWLIALPLGYFLAIFFNLKGTGLWWGIIISGFFGTGLLWLRWIYKLKKIES